ncbi:MAG: hypothetical protein FJX77_10695 [Armatimonadetes bacterium]|nr:hypothetical protein [Armatimonadota bacterium]
MWYVEESLTYCGQCERGIPVTHFWRGKGSILTEAGKSQRTMVLHSLCPLCGRRQSVGLNGPWYFRHFYAWLWKLRYPNVRRPEWEDPYRHEEAEEAEEAVEYRRAV